MWKKFMKPFMLGIVCLCFVLTLRSTAVMAAMADEAKDYELGETYSGIIADWENVYYKFYIDKKSHVTLDINVQMVERSHMRFYIYDNSGKIVLDNQEMILEKSKVTEVWSGSQYRVLPMGTYYLLIDGESGSDKEYSFSIQAEEQIKLPKGAISSLKSPKRGQMTVKCKTVSDALGYRIQYSTDVRFKKGVKTIYSSSLVKTITGLKKGQRYYVKVCPYSVYDDGTYAFGQNSSVKSVKVKK